MAGGSEFGSGALMALGLLGPIGGISAFGPMVMAWNKAHAGKPIWVTSGGAELPLTNIAVGTTLALTGPGRYSLDELFGIKVPQSLVLLTVVGVAAGVTVGILSQPEPAQPQEDEARGPLQGGTETEQSETDNASAS
jgi:putative oxidoreductase